MVRGMDRQQAIVILASHVSREYLSNPHGTTMNDTISIVCNAHFTRTATARAYPVFFNLYLFPTEIPYMEYYHLLKSSSVLG